jgi:hypothetical protein
LLLFNYSLLIFPLSQNPAQNASCFTLSSRFIRNDESRKEEKKSFKDGFRPVFGVYFFVSRSGIKIYGQQAQWRR